MVYGCFANKVLGLCFCFIGVQVTNWVHLHQNDYFLAHEYCWFWIIHLWFQNVCLILKFFHLQGSGLSSMENLLSEKNNVVSMHGLLILKSRFHCHSYSKCYSILRWDKIGVIIMRLTKASWNHLTTVMDVTSEFYFNSSSIFASLVQEWGIFANRNNSKF